MASKLSSWPKMKDNTMLLFSLLVPPHKGASQKAGHSKHFARADATHSNMKITAHQRLCTKFT